MLEINKLHAAANGKPILKGVNLTVRPGEIHAIMGPNGSGKSTLANVLAGNDNFEITSGSVSYLNMDLLEMPPEIRAREGLFLAFQYPVEMPGVNNLVMLKAALNARLKHEGRDEIDAADFLKLIESRLELVEMDKKLLHRSVNEGFSGGEKKRNEILQMAILEPRLAILDETDSGLDVDALQIVSKGINQLKRPDRSIILVTHYQRILDYVKPDFVHILVDGQITISGDKELALEVEKRGYGWLDFKN